MKLLITIAAFVPALVACKSESAKAQRERAEAPISAGKATEQVAAPCETALDLAKKLSDANGLNMDYGAPETQKTIDAAKAAIADKTFAFTNCYFSSQGNDEVSFKATANAKDDLDCAMVGGEEGNKKFRDAAMSIDMSKLRLDVRGVVKEHGEGQFRSWMLTDCEITPHE